MNIIRQFILSAMCLVGFCAYSQKATLVMPAGHAQKVSQIEVSFDHRFMASIDSTNTIIVWEIDGRRELLHLRESGNAVTNIAFHPSALILISSGSNGNIVYWDVQKGTIIKKIKAHNGGSLIKFVSDGSTLISGADNEVKLWNYKEGKVIGTIQTEEKVTSLAVSDLFSQVTIGTKTGNIVSFGLDDYEKKWGIKLSGQINDLSYYSKKPKVIAVTATGEVASIHVTKNEIIEKKRVQSEAINKILIDEQGGEIVVAGNDPSRYIKFLKSTTFDDDTSKKFKWSSTPKDELGLYSLVWGDSTNSVMLAGNHDNVIEAWDRISMTWSKSQFKGFSRPINSIDVNYTGELLAVGSNQTRLKILDLTGSRQPIILEGHKGGITSIDFHPDRDRLVSVGRDKKISIWKPDKYVSISASKDQISTRAIFTVNKKYIRRKAQKLETHNYANKDTKTIADIGSTFHVSSDGMKVGSLDKGGLTMYSSSLVKSGRIEQTSLTDFSFSGEKILALASDNKIYTIENNQLVRSFNLNKPADKVFGLSDGSFVVWSMTGSDANYSGYYYNSRGQEVSELAGHQNYITDVIELNNNILTASKDGTIKIWKKIGFEIEESATIILLRNQDYVVTTPNQLFDASATAMNKLHYVKDGQILSLSQLKELYYEPDLLAKIMGFNTEPIKERVDLSSIKIYPNFDILHPKDNNGKVGIRLKDNGGGIGKVVLIINGKEVSNDVRDVKTMGDDLDINYDIKGHPYMKSGINKITIKAYNKDGTLASEGKNIYVKVASGSTKIKSRLFAIIIGSADYASDDLDLNYSAKDASDFHDALKMSSINLFGADNVDIKLLTTDMASGTAQPIKKNILRVFSEFSKKARATDHLVVYMAGHGVNYTNGGNSDFYYLTSSAKTNDIRDDVRRGEVTISSTEMTELFKSVAALKQVLIVDACNSGNIDLKARTKKTMNSDQVRALERMKDRTGLFILAGSAADAVSYESPLYGQGLLTYSLLFGMKGAALKENKHVDILSLFQFAASKVPELSADIGGVQRPEIRVPTDIESFDLGILEDSDKEKIRIKSPKPVFVKSAFQDKKEFYDELNLGDILNTRFHEISENLDAPFVFVDKTKFSGSLVVNGRYERKDDKTKVEVRVFKDGSLQNTFTVNGNNALMIADEIIEKLLDFTNNK